MKSTMNLSRRDAIVAACSGLAAAVAPSFAHAQAHWPTEALHFIVPYPAGTPPDILTRYVGDHVSRLLNQPVVVENKVGAGGTVGTDYVAHAKPDGSTFLVTPSGTLTIAPWVQKQKYAIDDFAPVAELGTIDAVATVRPDAPFATFKDFVAAAKASPGKYTFASNGPGSATQLIGKILHAQAGIDVVEIPYKGATESMTDLIGGRVDIMYAPITVPQIKAGKLKGLANVGDRRNPQIPNVPTLAEQGFDLSKVPQNWFAVFAPKGTPDAIVAKLADTIQKVMETPDAKLRLEAISIQVDFKGSRELGKIVRADAAVMRDVVQK